MSFFYIGLVRGYSAPAVPSIEENDPELLPTKNIASWASKWLQLNEYIILFTYEQNILLLMKKIRSKKRFGSTMRCIFWKYIGCCFTPFHRPKVYNRNRITIGFRGLGYDCDRNTLRSRHSGTFHQWFLCRTLSTIGSSLRK